jgi:hypothetical protein
MNAIEADRSMLATILDLPVAAIPVPCFTPETTDEPYWQVHNGEEGGLELSVVRDEGTVCLMLYNGDDSIFLYDSAARHFGRAFIQLVKDEFGGNDNV